MNNARFLGKRSNSWGITILFALFFLSGFTALLYQVAWQRMLGLFSGSDVRSVTIVIACYLLGLGLGSLIISYFGAPRSGCLRQRLNSRQCVQIYGFCNLGIAVFAVFSRFLFYNFLFLKLRYLAQSQVLMLIIVFISLLIPTTLMGLSLPLLSKAINRNINQAASQIGWLYGVNTLGSGLGTLISGWYLIGAFGYEKTIYLGALLSALVGLVALLIAQNFSKDFLNLPGPGIIPNSVAKDQAIKQWYLLVFLSGFAAISWEIIWFRVLDIALQSNAYTYGHLLAFILVSNGLGSILGAKAIRVIREPKKVFLLIQGIVPVYSAMSQTSATRCAIWSLALYWQSHPDLRADIGYIDLNHLSWAVVFKYLIVPLVMIVPPSLLLGFYFPVVQKAVQDDYKNLGKRVGLIVVTNILGNTLGSLLTGLVLLEKVGTAGSIQLLCGLGLGFLLAIRPNWLRAKLISFLTIMAVIVIIIFPDNHRLWAAWQAVNPKAYFIVAEDSTSVAAHREADAFGNAETNGQGELFASGQVQAHFPYLHIHSLLGTIPALLHPHPTNILIIGLGSGGTPHTLGVNPVTQQIKVVELLGAELTVLKEYAKTPVGKPIQHLLEDPRYQVVVGDGRRELVLSQQKFDIIEIDAIQPWRSRAGMLYSQEFFQEVRSKLKPGGFFVQWNVGAGLKETMLSVFPYVTSLGIGQDLWILIGSDYPVDFNQEQLLTKLASPQVKEFLAQAGIDAASICNDVKAAEVKSYSQLQDGQLQPINTDLFPRAEYYLNN